MGIGADSARVARTLLACALFDAVPEPMVMAVGGNARHRRFRRNEVIFHQGDPGETLNVIDTGSVKITLVSPDGDEVILALLGVGDFFGELALFDDGPRSATAVAMEETETLELPRDAMDLLLDDRAVRSRVLKRVAAEIRRTDRQVERLRFLDLTGRVAVQLAEMAREYGRPGEDGNTTVTLPFRQADFAALVGGSRQAVNRAIRELEREGLLRSSGREMVVPDVASLAARAGA
jgi:CRP/FNR family cyclic AMP-dependent transcriptional regulator